MDRQLQKLRSVTAGVGKSTDVRVTGTELYLLPVRTRVPLKFGSKTLTSVTCARVRVQVSDRTGRTAFGWGETPLSVQWAWPSEISCAERHDAMVEFCQELVRAWPRSESCGHPMEVGSAFLLVTLPALRQQFNQYRPAAGHMPYLAALVCLSAFDIALHDAYGMLHNVPVYETLDERWMNHDLSWYLTPAEDADVDFTGKYPQDYLVVPPPTRLAAWHLVGGLDLLDSSELNGDPRKNALPVMLGDWIERDGLFCLKIKLRGNDAAWDYNRIVRVGKIALERGVKFLSTDFNCTVTEPSYVNDILDRVKTEEPAIDDLILYVEQPFPYELEDHSIDVHSVSRRKPLFMDESAHNWQQIRLGRALGWTGVALKTCKTQTGALLSLCWAKAHDMEVMVQDLTNPMLAQIPHVVLSAYAGTIMGTETNAMQFYPQASVPEAAYHPGIYARFGGHVDLSTIRGPGIGYHGAEAARSLPAPVASEGISTLPIVPPWHATQGGMCAGKCPGSEMNSTVCLSKVRNITMRNQLISLLQHAKVALFVVCLGQVGLDRLALADPSTPVVEPPKTNFWDGQHMARLRASHSEKDPKYKEVCKRLKKNADKAIVRGPYSVMDKKEVGPSGDKHDYLSLARYWWPNPDTADGLPYIRRDGKTNDKALEQGDHIALCNMCDDVETLALAGFYFNDAKYSRRAAELLRAWFLDPATRMNPNIKYGQAIPGRNDGRGSGIIDTRHFLRVIDSVALLRQAGAWTDEDDTALRAWMSKYLDWLLTSDAGQHEHAENNNHGTWYDVQTAAIALYVGKNEVARDIVEHAKSYRVARCIEPDGTQPAELERTRSLHYSIFNLSALSMLARLGEAVNVDLWSYQSPDGRSMRHALDYVTPYLTGQQEWEHQQIDQVNTAPADLALYYLAATHYHEPEYMRLLKEDSRKPGSLEYTRLLFPAE